MLTSEQIAALGACCADEEGAARVVDLVGEMVKAERARSEVLINALQIHTVASWEIAQSGRLSMLSGALPGMAFSTEELAPHPIQEWNFDPALHAQ